MANKAISELPQAQNVNNQDLFVLEQSGIAKKLTAETFITEQGIIDALAEALDGHGGIQSVTLSSVSGRIRTYRITFTDQSATTFQVYDGTSIDRISRTSSSGLDDVYTIFLSDGTTTFFTVHNGADGTVSEAMLNDALKDKAPAITETASGAIATFPDGADNLVMHNIVAEINPVQDLHGYANPWPAGGGVNMFNPETVAVGFINDGTGELNSQATTSRASDYIDVLPDTSYYIANSAPSGRWGAWYDENKTYISACNGIGVKTSPSNAMYMRITVSYSDNNIDFANNIIIAKSSSAVPFSPYSNICPISGRDSVEVEATGINIWDEEWEAVSNRNIRSKNLIPVRPSTTYAFVSPNEPSNGFRYYDADKNIINTVYSLRGSFTTPANCYYVWFAIGSTYGAVYNNDISINYPSTDHDYHAYQGSNSVSLSWQTEAGTVYGGTIDVATGLLTVTDANIESYAGETLSSTWISDRDVYAQGTTPTTGAQVVYKLATPQTYQLTPQEVKTLLGTNNVWADTGNVSVTYPADTKLFIENLTQPTEDDLVANQAITSGKYFMVGNSLYLALANIASGAQITIGTNAQRVSLADALNTINS